MLENNPKVSRVQEIICKLILMLSLLIQMKPSSLPEMIKTKDDRSRQVKIELKSVNCPQGTVPILRTNITTKPSRPVNSRGYGFGFRTSRVEVEVNYANIFVWKFGEDKQLF